jgi:hypothetical protein
MPYAIIVAGEPGPELDSFTEGLAAELERRGRRTAVLRQGPAVEPPPGPSARLETAGGRLNLELAQGEGTLEELMGRHLAGLDLALCLGWEQERRAKIELAPSGRPRLADDPGLKAVAGPAGAAPGKPSFDPADPAALAEHLLAEVVPAKERPRLRLVLGGRRIPAKEFVQDILAQTIRAMVGSLRGGDRPGRLEVYIEPEEGPGPGPDRS